MGGFRMIEKQFTKFRIRWSTDLRFRRHLIWLFTLLLTLCVVTWAAFFVAPGDFKEGHVVKIPEGYSITEVASVLRDEGMIRSESAFTFLSVILGNQGGIKAGSYYFEKSENVLSIAMRLTQGEYGLTPILIRIPEGASTAEMAQIFSNKLELFDEERFLDIGSELEGYLFPDSYYFLPTDTEEDVIERMQETFFREVRTIEEEIRAFGIPLKEAVIMASLLEREARDHEVRRRIAGVLWNRIEIGMPLQVDAVFVYLLGKGSFDLTLKDLALDSPYNTYQNIGLPPGPIASPSLSSIKAAVTPIPSEDLYYLADFHGVTHFSETFEEHKQKKALYLY